MAPKRRTKMPAKRAGAYRTGSMAGARNVADALWAAGRVPADFFWMKVRKHQKRNAAP